MGSSIYICTLDLINVESAIRSREILNHAIHKVISAKLDQKMFEFFVHNGMLCTRLATFEGGQEIVEHCGSPL